MPNISTRTHSQRSALRTGFHLGRAGRLLLGLGLLFLTACSSDKLVLTGERIAIDISNDESAAGESRLVNGGFNLTTAIANSEWRGASGSNNRAAPHALWGEKGEVDFYIHVGAGNGTDSIYPRRVRDIIFSEPGYNKNKRVAIDPIVADNKIFVADSRYQISAYDWARGQGTPHPSWINTMPGATDNPNGWGGGLAYGRGGANGKTPLVVVTTGYGRVFGLDATDGSIIFSQDLSSPIRNAAAITDSLAIVKTIAGDVIALSLRDGRRVWQNSSFITQANVQDSIGFVASSAPTLSAGRVWTGQSTGMVSAMNAGSGDIIWQDGSMTFTIGDNNRFREISANMVLDGGVIYAFTFGNDATAFRADSGARLWRKKLSTTSTPVVNNQTIFLVDSDYNLKAVNKATGNLFWSRPLEKYVQPGSRNLTLIEWRAPLLINKKLFLINNIGGYMVVNALNGTRLEEGQMDIFRADTNPVIANGTILILNNNGYLVGIR